MKTTAVGLKDIAEVVGVSVRTVNRALKQNGYVDGKIREQVLSAAAKLGYQPNLAARALRTGRSNEIAAVLGSLDDLHITKLSAFEQTIRQAGYSLLTMFAGGVEDTAALLAGLLHHAPAAVAVFPGVENPAGTELHTALVAAGIPDVFLDLRYDLAADAVRIDRPHGVAEAVRYLARTGRQRIAYLGPMDSSRLDGYRCAMAELGREPLHIVQPDERTGSFETFFALTPFPDAVQVYSDVMAMRLLAELHARSIRVPQDIAVVAFDNRDMAALSYPPLTTVAQPNRAVGEAAADVLLRKLRGEPAPAAGWSRLLLTSLVQRQSA